APLALWPMNGKAAMMAMAASQVKKAVRRTPLIPSIETASRMNPATPAKKHWRIAKWNGSATFIRAAAAGLEANDSMTPSTMRVITAASRRRSQVHHHMPSGLRSVRAKAWVWVVIGQAPDPPPRDGIAGGFEG